MVIAAMWLGARLGRWLVLEQVKELLARMARSQNITVAQLLGTATLLPAEPKPPEQYHIQQVNGCYYAWGPEGFAAQAHTAAELLRLLRQSGADIAVDPAELNMTPEELTEITKTL